MARSIARPVGARRSRSPKPSGGARRSRFSARRSRSPERPPHCAVCLEVLQTDPFKRLDKLYCIDCYCALGFLTCSWCRRPISDADDLQVNFGYLHADCEEEYIHRRNEHVTAAKNPVDEEFRLLDDLDTPLSVRRNLEQLFDEVALSPTGGQSGGSASSTPERVHSPPPKTLRLEHQHPMALRDTLFRRLTALGFRPYNERVIRRLVGDEMKREKAKKAKRPRGRNKQKGRKPRRSKAPERRRARMAVEEVAILQKAFTSHRYPSKSQYLELSRKTGLPVTSIQGWFAGKRYREKKKRRSSSAPRGRRSLSSHSESIRRGNRKGGRYANVTIRRRDPPAQRKRSPRRRAF